jgi:hypothetical protein
MNSSAQSLGVLTRLNTGREKLVSNPVSICSDFLFISLIFVRMKKAAGEITCRFFFSCRNEEDFY